MKTDHGTLPIEQIKPGMRVLAWNEKTGLLTYSLVQQTFVRTANEIYRVKYDDGSVIETTWSHPFYITGTGWVKGKDLRPGMKSPTAKAIAEHNQRMAMSGGYRLPVKMVSFTNDNTGKREASVLLAEDLPGAMTIETVEVLPGKETVYNFSVEDAHSYFVGEDGVLVHNEKYWESKSISWDADRRKEYIGDKYGNENLDQKEKEYMLAYEKAYELSKGRRFQKSSLLCVDCDDGLNLQLEIDEVFAALDTDWERDAFLRGLETGDTDGDIMTLFAEAADSYGENGKVKNKGIILNARKRVNLPPIKSLKIAMRHIKDRHMKPLGVATVKDQWPKRLSEGQVEASIKNAYLKGKRVQTQDGRVKVRGPSGWGFEVEMWVNTKTREIETAYPTK